VNRHLCAIASLALLFLVSPLRAANGPHVGADGQRPLAWTNDDLEKLHGQGLISIVGQVDEDRSPWPSAPETYVRTQDPEWYAAQATKLRGELDQRQGQLRDYQLALDDARSLRETTGGISFDYDDVGITPEAGIDILQQRVNEAQTELTALEDLARQNDIPPGALRDQ
jgi:hypothetical protein